MKENREDTNNAKRDDNELGELHELPVRTQKRHKRLPETDNGN